MRTTVDIDEPILQELRKRQKAVKQSLGRLVSDLLAQALRLSASGKSKPHKPHWHSKRMGARVDLADRDALYDAMLQDRNPERSGRA